MMKLKTEDISTKKKKTPTQNYFQHLKQHMNMYYQNTYEHYSLYTHGVQFTGLYGGGTEGSDLINK